MRRKETSLDTRYGVGTRKPATGKTAYQSLNISHKNLMTCTLIVMLHKYIICFDLDMYFLIDSNMSTTVVAINKHMHLVMFYYFAVINFKYHNLLYSYIYIKLTAFYCL